MATKFKLTIKTIDNQILEFPRTLWFDCDKVVPLGQQIIRQFNGSECIVAKKVYLIGYRGQRFGTSEFVTMDDFISYRNNNCVSDKDECCVLTIGGCILYYNDKPITFKKQ